MDQTHLRSLLESLQRGGISADAAFSAILASQDQPLQEVTLDLDRLKRCGFSEVIYGEGKSLETMRSSAERLLAAGQDVLITRIAPESAAALLLEFPAAVHCARGRTLRIEHPGKASASPCGKVAVITAGTTDLPVAEEACETLRWMNVEFDLLIDVGVAGPHRLPAQVHRLLDCDAVVVVAGMEAALPSVVAGYVACPVIGVPTSVGYGANFFGLAAVLSMLNSCAAHVCVVNIDAGFKGGYVAGMIARRARANVK